MAVLLMVLIWAGVRRMGLTLAEECGVYVFSCRSPALGVMVFGLRGLSRRGRRSYRVNWFFVGAPPSGRWFWFAGVYRDGGVDPTGSIFFVGAPPSGRWFWFAGVIATRASLLQGQFVFCRSPALGAIVLVCGGYRDEGVAPTGSIGFL